MTERSRFDSGLEEFVGAATSIRGLKCHFLRKENSLGTADNNIFCTSFSLRMVFFFVFQTIELCFKLNFQRRNARSPLKYEIISFI